MGWADSATGGGYGGGGSRGGGGGYSGGFGGQVDTGGVSSGSSGGGGSSSGGGFMDSVDTGGVADAGATGGSEGGTTSRGASRADQAGRTSADLGMAGGVSSAAIDSASSVAGGLGAVTDGAIASFSDEVDATPVDGFSGQVDARAMSTAQQTEMAQQNIQSQAKPGIVGRIGSMAASVASPVAGMTIDTVARGYNASQTAQAHNAEFGTSVDTGLASNIGSQTVGAVGGFTGSKVGGLIGGRLGGSMAGIPGAVATGLVGSIGGQNLGRSVAMGGLNGQGSSPGTGMGSDGQIAMGGDATMVADASTPGTVQSPSVATPAYGPVDFDGYASYAAAFYS